MTALFMGSSSHVGPKSCPAMALSPLTMPSRPIPLLSSVMKGAVQDTKVWLFDTATAIEKLPKVIASEKRYFVIGKSPVTLMRIEEAGISLHNANGKINVGPMSARADTTTIGPNQSVNAQEIAAFDWLTQRGHQVEFRLVPDASCYSWQDARQKLK